MYDNALLVTAIAVATFAVFKIIQYVKRYLEWSRICRKIHGHPTHWLFGNLNRVGKTSIYLVLISLVDSIFTSVDRAKPCKRGHSINSFAVNVAVAVCSINH